MKVLVFGAQDFDRAGLGAANAGFGHDLHFVRTGLDRTTAPLAAGYEAVVAFVNDRLDAPVLEVLAAHGVRAVALRCAGFNNLDVAAANRLGLKALHVPTYSEYAVAEHVFALALSLVRRIPWAYSRVRDGNFTIEGLVGFNLRGRTFGIIGMGRIGRAVSRIAMGFGCPVVAYDPAPPGPQEDPAIRRLSVDEVVAAADLLSLHAPLTPETHYLLNAERIARMKPGAILINTGRGGLIDTQALVAHLKDGHLGGVGLDVYEEEERVFYTDLSDKVLADDVLARLLSFRNVLVTSHMGFLTREALADIAGTVLQGLADLEAGRAPAHPVPGSR